VPGSQNRNRTIFNYLNFTRSLNKRSLMEFWSSCFIELSAKPAGKPPYPPVGALTYAQGPHATYEKISRF